MIKSSCKFLFINKSEIERSYTEIQIPKNFRGKTGLALDDPPTLIPRLLGQAQTTPLRHFPRSDGSSTKWAFLYLSRTYGLDTFTLFAYFHVKMNVSIRK